MAWADLSQEQKLAKLTEVIELSDEGVIRLKPLNPDGQPHQRFSVGPKGISVSDDDPNPNWYASGNAYFGGRVGIQAAVGFDKAPEDVRKHLGFNAKYWQTGFPSSLQVENNNIPDQVTAQFWQACNTNDTFDQYVAWFTSGDSSRPNGRNTGIRIDAVNDQGQVGARTTAIEANLFGADISNYLIDRRQSSDPSRGFYPETLPVAPPAPALNWLQSLIRKWLKL